MHMAEKNCHRVPRSLLHGFKNELQEKLPNPWLRKDLRISNHLNVFKGTMKLRK